MNAENIVCWLQGFLEGKEQITTDELIRIKDIINCPHVPSAEQLDKMMTKLFPDKVQEEINTRR